MTKIQCNLSLKNSMAIIDFDNKKTPTKAMINYIQLLLNEANFTHNSRNVWLSDLYKRKIHHLDDLSIIEGHEVIEKLKLIRDTLKRAEI